MLTFIDLNTYKCKFIYIIYRYDSDSVTAKLLPKVLVPVSMTSNVVPVAPHHCLHSILSVLNFSHYSGYLVFDNWL